VNAIGWSGNNGVIPAAGWSWLFDRCLPDQQPAAPRLPGKEALRDRVSDKSFAQHFVAAKMLPRKVTQIKGC
jgi:hypothetical protein